jgi:hypothetical protein
MMQPGAQHDEWSMIEGPTAVCERTQECEWMLVEGEATASVPKMSWADIARQKPDESAILEAEKRLQQQQWTQIPSPNSQPSKRREQSTYMYDSDDYDDAEGKLSISRKRVVDLDASRTKRFVAQARKRNNRIPGGRYANRVFGRQYDVHDDREVRREMKEKPGRW